MIVLESDIDLTTYIFLKEEGDEYYLTYLARSISLN